MENRVIYKSNIKKFKETDYLFLNSKKAKSKLNWLSSYSLKQTIKKTCVWYKNFYLKKCNIYNFSIKEIKDCKNMKIAKLPIKDCYKILFKPNKDGRGYLQEHTVKKNLRNLVLMINVQNNLSFNKNKSTLRGLHFQTKPFEEDKLVRCIQGSVMDYVLDLRKNLKLT